MNIAESDRSGVLGRIREAIASAGRIEPDNAKSPTFAQTFEAAADPAGAQLVLEQKTTARGARLLVLSQNRGDGELPEVLFQTSTDETGAVQLVLERLTGWAKWLSLFFLDNPRRGLEVEFEIRAKTRGALAPALAQRPDLTLVAGQTVEYIVTNKSGKDVYFAILDLASDGSVDVLYPDKGPNEALAPGKRYSASAETLLPEGQKAVRDHLKLVVTQSPVDFRFLRQEIKEVPRDGDDPLSQLLGEAALIERQVPPIPAKLDGWVTKIKTLEVVDKP